MSEFYSFDGIKYYEVGKIKEFKITEGDTTTKDPFWTAPIAETYTASIKLTTKGRKALASILGLPKWRQTEFAFPKKNKRGRKRRRRDEIKKLKPCPFCGNQDVKMEKWGPMFYVTCHRYTCATPSINFYYSAKVAAREWNRRVNDG